MEEAVVGATIQVVLQNLLLFSVEEIGLIWNFKKDVEKLKVSFKMIEAFLEDAEKKQITSKPVQLWLRKLEAVAFNADYVFDVLNYHVIRKKVQRDSMKKKVRSFFPSSISFALRYRMTKKIKYIKNELKSINEEASGFGLHTTTHASVIGTNEVGYRPETDSKTLDRVFLGREGDVRKIVDMVENIPTERKLSVIPIVGMGGLGKTTLAREVFHDDHIKSCFENRIWVYVSENFVPETVFKSVFESLTGEKVEGSREVVLTKLQAKIGEKRYFLVLDDVWNDDGGRWYNFITSLERISPPKGNVVLVTTRKENTASMVKTNEINLLGFLTEKDCWGIIKDRAFEEDSVPLEFETMGEHIAKKCGGLPLAAKLVGSLLRGKSEDEWRSIEKKWLSCSNSVSNILKLSYDDLPSPSIKKCFAYCSLLPKGWLMQRDEMIHLWMAEGFLQSDAENDMEIVGNRVFSILLQSSSLQVQTRTSYETLERFGMHDLVHDLASSILDGDIYLSRSFANASSHITEDEAKCLRALFFNGEISNIRFSNLTRLHVLILNDSEMKELPMEIGKLICLRLLDISNTQVECLPDSIGDLYHLQTLKATKEYGGICCLRKLPQTLVFLSNLRHLYIPNIELPPGIRNLSFLQSLPYFRVGSEDVCRIMELGSLKNLRGALEINNLEKVRDEEEVKFVDLFHKPNILNLKFVWNPSRENEENNDENVLDALQPHWNLKSLVIEGFKGYNFPLWTSMMEVREDQWIRLDNLLEIKLSNCIECEEIPVMGHLRLLKSLYLDGLSKVKSFYGIKDDDVNKEMIVVYPALEKLELVNMTDLCTWADVGLPSSSETQPHNVSAFPCLEYLKIVGCRELRSAPSHFPCLKVLEIDGMESGIPLASICGSKLTTLTNLKIRLVKGLSCLPNGLFSSNLDLLELEIWSCSNLSFLVPYLGGGGASLRKMLIRNCVNFEKLPEDLYKLNALEELKIWECPKLKAVAYPRGKQFTSLRRLVLPNCSGLTDLLDSCSLTLENLYMEVSSSGLPNFPHLMNIMRKMSRLEILNIRGCLPMLSEVSVEIGSLGSIKTLRIGGCGDYVFIDRILPAFSSLRELTLFGMEEWDALPDQLQHLTNLHRLYLWNFGVEVLPEWLERLSSLTYLNICKCKKLRHVASNKAMQGLTRLNSLWIVGCLLLQQNLEEDRSTDSEWSKLSHIPNIWVDSVNLRDRFR